MPPKTPSGCTSSSKKSATSTGRKRAATSVQASKLPARPNSWNLFSRAFHMKLKGDLEKKGIKSSRAPKGLNGYIRQAWATAPPSTKPYFQQLAAAIARQSSLSSYPATQTSGGSGGTEDVESVMESSSSATVHNTGEVEEEEEEVDGGEGHDEEADNQEGRPPLTIKLPARRSVSKDSALTSPLTELSEDPDEHPFIYAEQVSSGPMAEHGPTEEVQDAAATAHPHSQESFEGVAPQRQPFVTAESDRLQEAAREGPGTVVHGNLPRLTLSLDVVHAALAPWPGAE